MKRLFSFIAVFFVLFLGNTVFAQDVDSFVEVFDKLAGEIGKRITSSVNKKAFEFVTIIEECKTITFKMGGEQEKLVHDVTLTKPFEMQKTEVTQLQWALVMGENPSRFKGHGSYNRPVEHVTWNKIQVFIKKLNELDSKYEYRLPTEAEWEYAARGELKDADPEKVKSGEANKKYFFGDDSDQLGNYSWYLDNSSKRTYDVALKKANQYGLYDVFGNVLEWVQDRHGGYKGGSVKDPK